MNIPEITTDFKPTRNETVAPAYAVERQTPEGGPNAVPSDAVQNHEDINGEMESHDFSREELDALVEEAQKQLDKNDVKLKFNLLEENDTIQVEIVDTDGKTIRKIPDDELIKLSESLKNLDRGFINEVF